MNTDVYGRIGQIKQYINALSEHVAANDQHSSANIISKFKKAVLKDDPSQHANQFLLDCLRTKNQKLQIELEQLQIDKRACESRLGESKGTRKNMREVQVGMFLSRLTVTLNDVRKVDYDQVTLNCDYQQIKVNSLIGQKYKDYPLYVQCVDTVQYKQNFVHLAYTHTQTINILLRFTNDRDLQRWVTGLKFGMLIQTNSKKTHLFQPKKEEPASPPQLPLPPALQPEPLLQVPPISFPTPKPASPNQSVSAISERKDRSMEKSLNDKMEKNTERSLVNAMEHNLSVNYSKKSLTPSNHQPVKKFKQSPPPPINITRIRGLSENIDNSFQVLKRYGTHNPRKKSEDILGNFINQAYHNRMLQEVKQREAGESSVKNDNSSKSNKFGPKLESSASDSSFRNHRISSLQERKKQLLSQVSNVNDKHVFPFENSKVSWAGIEEMDDENKSKSSIKLSEKSRRDSIVTESIKPASKDSHQLVKQQKSEHISQKSQEESPTLSKSPFTKMSASSHLQIPHKISYSDGTVFRLHRVEKESDPNLQKSKMDIDEQLKPEKSQISKQSMTSESQSHDHSDPSSHQNHTQSEDNNVRAQELKKGIILTKYSQNGFWPHQKIIYLSQNQSDICYRDLKDKKVKKIKISNIKSVQYKKFDKGIIKHVSKIEEDRCLVIRALVQQNKIKNFQFVSGHPEPLQRFAANLNLFMEYSSKH